MVVAVFMAMWLAMVKDKRVAIKRMIEQLHTKQKGK